MNMEVSGPGKSPNTTLSFRYNANNEVLEELFEVCDDDPPTPQCENSSSMRSESASPKRGDKAPSILDKYFKSIRATDKSADKAEKDEKTTEPKSEEAKSPPKDVTASPVKEYLNRLSKRSESSDVKEVGSNETWKIFHDFKFKIAQAVEDIKTRSADESKEKSVPRDNSISDSEENSAIKDSDQSVGDTDNQVSSLHSSIQNLSEVTQPLTAKPTDLDMNLPFDKNNSEHSDATQKNLVYSENYDFARDGLSDNLLEVESGIEALEDSLDAFADDSPPPPFEGGENSDSHFIKKPQDIEPPPSKEALPVVNPDSFFNFTLYFLTFLVIFNYVVFPEIRIWNGFLLGIWSFYVISKGKEWILSNFFGEWKPTKKSFFPSKRSSYKPTPYTIPSVKEHRPLKKYEGWINHYRFPEYDPYEYSVNKTTSSFMKLEGCNLRISYTRTKVAKRALWDEKLEEASFYQHRLYNLTGARIILLPKGLVRRRHWSKKYPICIILSDYEKIHILEKEVKEQTRVDTPPNLEKRKESIISTHDVEVAETNTSPEKRKKFVWRRKDKRPSDTSSQIDPEPLSKEGLRHRLARKMHRESRDKENREKKPDSITEQPVEADKPSELIFHDAEADLTTKSTTSTKDVEVDEELDEHEYSRIKEFIESTDFETGTDAADGEWSLHVRRDKRAKLFLFTRTGRDKHEWYRRIATAIYEASATTNETPVADDKLASESKISKDEKEAGEMAVYKAGDKETVTFAKTKEGSEGSPITNPMHLLSSEFENYEKQFWGFLKKIIESRSSIGGPCECRRLPAEVTWLNTMVARIAYDLMRNQAIVTKLHTKIQKKLDTIKLPPFMSPLIVTELSLTGACPLVHHVSAPTWDERGVWLDADIAYEGGAYISILTQINLMKLKEKNATLEETILTTTVSEFSQEIDTATFSSFVLEKPPLQRKPKAAIYDSDAEDSAESSEDEESPPLQPVDSNDYMTGASESGSMAGTEAPQSSSSKKKFLRMVDRIATNKYFQQVTDYKYVKRAMEGLSNTDIKLHVEVQGLEGRLALNLPSPPHDRVWFGFRTNPQLVLKARPAVGARTLRFAHISNWIEQKLGKEFEKILVLPNMEDIIVDVMAPTPAEFE